MIQACQKCEMGFYATQSNYSNCTYHTKIDGVESLQYLPCLAGAVSCQQCPSETPNTHTNGSTSLLDCKKCKSGEYMLGGTGPCTACAQKCTSDQYEASACTQTTDRMCHTCFHTRCGTTKDNLGMDSIIFSCERISRILLPPWLNFSLPIRWWGACTMSRVRRWPWKGVQAMCQCSVV